MVSEKSGERGNRWLPDQSLNQATSQTFPCLQRLKWLWSSAFHGAFDFTTGGSRTADQGSASKPGRAPKISGGSEALAVEKGQIYWEKKKRINLMEQAMSIPAFLVWIVYIGDTKRSGTVLKSNLLLSNPQMLSNYVCSDVTGSLWQGLTGPI